MAANTEKHVNEGDKIGGEKITQHLLKILQNRESDTLVKIIIMRKREKERERLVIVLMCSNCVIWYTFTMTMVAYN